jgi:tetratricopeptide (TPR) repeat protein
LATPISERPNHLVDSCIAEPDVILALLGELRDRCNTVPAIAHEEAANLFRLLNERPDRVGIFDEGQYFAGEAALMAGATCRLLGKREDAELWFDRAESRYQRTINPGAALGRVSLERLVLLYDARRYERVFEILPSLVESFGKWGMVREALKCRLLEAMTLKETARLSEAVDRFRSLKNDANVASEPAMHGVILAHLAELLSSNAEHLEATSIYKEALSLQHHDPQPIAVAHLKVAMGEGLREQGRVEEAVDSYRSAISDYAGLGMQTYAAYLRVVTSEMLIALSRYREAEWEILAAMPTIEEQKMVPEGFAAVALLKESVRRRKTDPNALRELREHLQASK